MANESRSDVVALYSAGLRWPILPGRSRLQRLSAGIHAAKGAARLEQRTVGCSGRKKHTELLLGQTGPSGASRCWSLCEVIAWRETRDPRGGGAPRPGRRAVHGGKAEQKLLKHVDTKMGPLTKEGRHPAQLRRTGRFSLLKIFSRRFPHIPLALDEGRNGTCFSGTCFSRPDSRSVARAARVDHKEVRPPSVALLARRHRNRRSTAASTCRRCLGTANQLQG